MPSTPQSEQRPDQQMSQPSELIDVPEEPEQVFEQLVETNELVCRNCYRRLRRRDEIDWSWGTAREELLPFVDYELPPGYTSEIAEREYYETSTIDRRTPTVHHPSNRSGQPNDDACWNCGSIDTSRTPSETRSREAAIAAAASISTTLHEYGVGHDWLYLLGRVRDLKRRPSTAGNDFEVFRTAVAGAIEAVQ